MNREEWLDFGFDHGFCSRPVCAVHDWLPSTAEEEQDFCEGLDPCIVAIRVYHDDAEKQAVEDNDGILKSGS
jgi:hypothetical protein